MSELMRQIRRLFDGKYSALHQQMYADLLAGNPGTAGQSAQRIACLEECLQEIEVIHKRLIDNG